MQIDISWLSKCIIWAAKNWMQYFASHVATIRCCFCPKMASEVISEHLISLLKTPYFMCTDVNNVGCLDNTRTFCRLCTQQFCWSAWTECVYSVRYSQYIIILCFCYNFTKGAVSHALQTSVTSKILCIFLFSKHHHTWLPALIRRGR